MLADSRAGSVEGAEVGAVMLVDGGGYCYDKKVTVR